MYQERKKQLDYVQDVIGVKFNNINLLDAALTHSSYANQFNLSYNHHNERLEFLGDSVLSIVISEYLYKKYSNKPEGRLTKIRAGIVCETSLAKGARAIHLNEYLLIGKGEEVSGGRNKASLVADAYEAVIASIYLDHGYDVAKNFILKTLSAIIEESGTEKKDTDYKTQLQEYVQKNYPGEIKYEVTNDWGPDHDKVFEVELFINSKSYGRATGKSKKEAQQKAASRALIELGAVHE